MVISHQFFSFWSGHVLIYYFSLISLILRPNLCILYGVIFVLFRFLISNRAVSHECGWCGVAKNLLLFLRDRWVPIFFHSNHSNRNHSNRNEFIVIRTAIESSLGRRHWNLAKLLKQVQKIILNYEKEQQFWGPLFWKGAGFESREAEVIRQNW